MKLFVLRVEKIIKTALESMAEISNTNLSEVGRDIIVVGIAVGEKGGIDITGPFGLRRSLAKMDFGGERERFSIWIDEVLLERAKKVFNESEHSAIRASLRLGILVFEPEVGKITGPLGISRPLLTYTIPQIEDKEAQNSIERLRRIFNQIH